MGMLQTFMGSYEPMRADVTTPDTTLSPETAGATYDWHDKPSTAYKLRPEHNGCEIILAGGYNIALHDDTSYADTSNNKGFEATLFAYAENGPAEFLCDLTGIVGTARINDYTLSLWIDTITIDTEDHLKDISIADSGNNRIAKIVFDTVGYSWLYLQFNDMTGSITPLIRPF